MNGSLSELEGRGDSKCKGVEVRKRIMNSKSGKKFGGHKGDLRREQGSEAKREVVRELCKGAWISGALEQGA